MEGPQQVTEEPLKPMILTFPNLPTEEIKGELNYRRSILSTQRERYDSLSPGQHVHFLKQTQLYTRAFCTGLCGFTFILLLCLSPLSWVQFLLAENGLELHVGLWTLCEHKLCWSNVPIRPYYLQISRFFFLFSAFTAFIILIWITNSCRHRKDPPSGLDGMIAIFCLISGVSLFICLVLFMMQVNKYTSYTMGSSYLWTFHFNWWGSFFYIVAGILSFFNFKALKKLLPELDVTKIPLTRRRLGISPNMWPISATEEDPDSEMVVDSVVELDSIETFLEKKDNNRVNNNK